MTRRTVHLLVLLICAGCPGQRRPDPRFVSPPAMDARKETPPPAKVQPPASRTPGERLSALTAGLSRLEQQKAAFDAASTGPAWEKLIAEIDALQTEAFALQEVEDEALLDRLYPLLEQIELIRADVVSNQPK